VLWLTLGLLLMATLVFSVYTIATWGPIDDANGVTNGPPVGLIAAGIFGGFIGGVICLAAWWQEEGVRGPGRWFGLVHGMMYRTAFAPATPPDPEE
jgi:hypothetical protein